MDGRAKVYANRKERIIEREHREGTRRDINSVDKEINGTSRDKVEYVIKKR